MGRIVPTHAAGRSMQSEILLEWGVGGQALRFRGQWVREDEPGEFVTGIIAWDPVHRQIAITGVFYHGAYFHGDVAVLDRGRSVLQRRWTGHYPDGRAVEFRETWTPISADAFEWLIEQRRDGEWVADSPPGVSGVPMHRIIRDSTSQYESVRVESS
ncbi:MAG: hypothetical protein ACREM1_20995 [Longimicrobiales bacterium]